MSFIFGEGTPWTQKQLEQRRKMIEALDGTLTRAPRNVGEGLTAIGNALAARRLEQRANKRDAELQAEFDSQWDAALGGLFGGGALGGGMGAPAPTGAAPAGPVAPPASFTQNDALALHGGPTVAAADALDGSGFVVSPETRAAYAPTPGALNISMDFNAVEGGGARGTEVIIPDNASPEVRAAAEAYNQMVAEFAAQNGIADYPVRGVRTRSENGRGVPHTVHVEPFFNDDQAMQAAIQANPEAFAAIYKQAFGNLPNARLIAPHGVGADRGAASPVFGDETSYGQLMANALLGRDAQPPTAQPVTASARGVGQPGARLAAALQLAELAGSPRAAPGFKALAQAVLGQELQAMQPQSEADMLALEKSRFELARLRADAARGPEQPERRTEKDRNGVLRYVDTQEPVFPDVETADAGGDMTESERRIFMFSAMQKQTGPAINQIEDEGFNPSGFRNRFPSGSITDNWIRTPEGRQYQAAASAWSEAALRLATGAAATPEESTRIQNMYFAQVGDDPETIQFKRAMREGYQNVLDATLKGDPNAPIPNPLTAFAATPAPSGNGAEAPATPSPAPQPTQATPMSQEVAEQAYQALLENPSRAQRFMALSEEEQLEAVRAQARELGLIP